MKIDDIIIVFEIIVILLFAVGIDSIFYNINNLGVFLTDNGCNCHDAIGCTVIGKYAITYQPSFFIALHEALHLKGADEITAYTVSSGYILLLTMGIMLFVDAFLFMDSV